MTHPLIKKAKEELRNLKMIDNLTLEAASFVKNVEIIESFLESQLKSAMLEGAEAVMVEEREIPQFHKNRMNPTYSFNTAFREQNNLFNKLKEKLND